MSRARRIRFILVAALLAMIVLAFVLQRPGTAPAVRFLGYTNAPGWRDRLAVFGLTNESRATIKLWRAVDAEFKGLPRPEWTINFGPELVLRRNQSEVLLVPMDTNMIFTNQRAWRAVFRWRSENVGTRFTDWANTSPLMPPFLQSSSMRVKRRPSDWIEQ